LGFLIRSHCWYLDQYQKTYMSARNLQRAEVVTDTELSTYKIVNAQHLILAESAVNSINSNLNTK